MIADLGGLRPPQPRQLTTITVLNHLETGYHAEQHASILAMQMWRSTAVLRTLYRLVGSEKRWIPLVEMTTRLLLVSMFPGCRPLLQEVGVHLTHSCFMWLLQSSHAGTLLARLPSEPQHCSCYMGDGAAGAPLSEWKPNLTVGPAVLVWMLTARFRLAPATNGRDPAHSTPTDQSVFGFELGRTMVPRNWASRERLASRQTAH
jgi:hypothetical protein